MLCLPPTWYFLFLSGREAATPCARDAAYCATCSRAASSCAGKAPGREPGGAATRRRAAAAGPGRAAPSRAAEQREATAAACRGCGRVRHALRRRHTSTSRATHALSAVPRPPTGPHRLQEIGAHRRASPAVLGQGREPAARALAARPRGLAQAAPCRCGRGLVRQERADLAARAAVARLPAAARPGRARGDRFRQSALPDRRGAQDHVHPRQLRQRLHRAPRDEGRFL